MLNDRVVLVVGVAAMSAVATAGWIRHTPVTIAPQATNFTAPVVEREPMLPVQSAAFYPAGAPVNRVTAPLRARPVRHSYDDRRVYDDDRAIAKRRSTAKSAAIIGGGAAAGAAVGAMAGGGKGAAIGALTGGAGGYVYDRVTKNRDDTIDTRDRSTGERVAIIGGGAAAGAAIGAIAGGGKGAAIGALTGGAGGYIYDRVTKNR